MRAIVREMIQKKKQKKKTLSNSKEMAKRNLFMTKCKE